MKRKLTSGMLVGVLLASTSAEAQDRITEFNSYGQALNLLLAPDNDLFDFINLNGIVDPTLGTSCPLLAETAGDTIGLGSNLFRNCSVDQNGASGSTRSVGFSGSIPTSTFLSFASIQTRESQDNPGSSRQPSNRRNFIAVADENTGVALSAWAFAQETDTDDTLFEPSQDENTVGIGLSYTKQSLDGGSFGLLLSFASSDRVSNSPPIINSTGTGLDPMANEFPLFLAFQDACNSISGGVSDAKQVALDAYRVVPLSGARTLQVHAGISRTTEEYNQDLCYFTQRTMDSFLQAGRIAGDRETYSFRFGGTLSSHMQFGSVSFRPQFSLDYEHIYTPGYGETESSLTSVNQSLSISVPGEPVDLTGASLRYDSQNYDSLRARLGGTAFIPSGRGGLFSVGAFFVTDFIDDPREVDAQFVEDMRDDPFEFSFRTNPPPSDYIELGLGYTYTPQREEGFNVQIGANAILFDDIYSGYTVAASISKSF